MPLEDFALSGIFVVNFPCDPFDPMMRLTGWCIVAHPLDEGEESMLELSSFGNDNADFGT